MALTFVRRLTSIRVRDVLLAGLLLILLGDRLLPGIRAFAQEGDGDAAPRVALLNSFTYQGRLEVDGVPVTGIADFEFSLFDVASGGAALEMLPILTGVPVDNGLFTVQLSFANSSFQGDRRWLNVRARPDAQAGFTLLGRQELTATPYALYAKSVAYGGDGAATTAARSDHTHVGQAWSSSAFYRGLQVTNTSTAAGSTAIHGITTGEFTGAIGGEATNGGVGVTGTSIRIAGDGDPDRNIGVVGRACEPGGACPFQDATAARAGVYGESSASTGVFGIGTPNSGGPDTAGVVGRGRYGMSAQGTAIGILARGNTGVNAGSTKSVGSDFFPDAAVIAENTGSAECPNINSTLLNYCVGVYGSASLGVAAIGVYGFGNRVGVYGDAPAGQLAVFANGITYSAGAYQTSDSRYKTAPVASAGLAEILALQPRAYRWANPEMDDGKLHQGLFAQEVQAVLPDLVMSVEGPGEAHLALNYVELIPVLICAIQEQQAEIEALKARLD